MRKRFICSLVVSFTGVSLALAQAPVKTPYGQSAAELRAAEDNPQPVAPVPDGKVQTNPPSAANLNGCGAGCNVFHIGVRGWDIDVT